ncbi:MAG: hypothetical protein AMXMBFR33_32680 [Candidatus Xenobia bacterium]
MSQTSARILVLEDDPDMRDLLREVLTSHGYEVVSVARGEEAVQQAASAHFDLIVADIRMEGMDGLEALERTKKQQPDIGSLVVSGYASDEEVARAQSLQVGGYLRKPFRMNEFLNLVGEQLRGRYKGEERRAQGSVARDGLLWALESLARVADAAGLAGPPRAERVGTLAENLALELGMATEVARQLRVAAMLAAVDAPETRPPAWLIASDLLSVMGQALKQGNPAPVESRVVSLALEAGTPEESPEPDELARRAAGRFDPELLEFYARARLRPAAGAPTPAPARPTGLLALARTLERAGDLASATQAYQAAARNGGREGVQALLGLARLEPAQAPQRAAEACREAAALGPVARAQAALEGGVVLYELRHGGAPELLEEARESCSRLGLTFEEAQARLLLARTGRTEPRLGEVLSYLLNPRQAGELPPWLGVEMLELNPPVELVRRLLNAFPGALARAVSRQQLTAEARKSLLGALEPGLSVAPELLQALTQDPQLRDRVLNLQHAASPEALLRVTALGPFEVVRGDRVLDEREWKTQKTRYLFAFLACRWGTFFSEDQVLDEFWPDDMEKGKKNLYWSTSVARRALRGSDENAGPEILLRDRRGLALNPEVPHWHDVLELNKAYEEATRLETASRPAEAVAAYRRLAQLYQGSYLEGCYMNWAVEERSQLERKTTEALVRLARLLASSQRYQEALEAARQALSLGSHRQDAHLLVMRAHLGLGQPELAVKQFQRCEEILRREYDLEPTTELLEYFHRARLGMGDAEPRARMP